MANKVLFAAHKLSHVQRYVLHDVSMLSGPKDVPRYRPFWLDEGIAKFHGGLILSDSGFYSYTVFRDKAVIHVSKSRDSFSSLRDLETGDGFGSSKYGYTYAFFAAELLAFLAGEGALYDFYAALDPGDSWEREFKSVFGMSVGEFYVLFDEHMAAGFPDLGFPK